MRQVLPSIVLLLAVVGCATATPAREQWWAARDRQPLNFVVSADQADAVWARAQECVVTVAPGMVMPIQTVTDVIIQTMQPTNPSAAEVFFTITRMKQPDGSSRFNFQASTFNPFNIARAGRLGQACAYYSASGIPVPR